VSWLSSGNFGDDGEILPFLLSLGTLLTKLTSGEQNGQPAVDTVKEVGPGLDIGY
jgi:hypothetical protein